MVTPHLPIAMPTTTSLKLPDEVKELAASAAQHQGMTLHAFMVEAIRTAAASAERRAAFVADALAARSEATESGKGYSSADVHAYIRARAHGRSTTKPKVKDWRG